MSGATIYAYADGEPVSSIDPLGLETYQCTRKLNNVPFRIGPLFHQYVRTGNAKDVYTCKGLGPDGGNPFNAPGKIESDKYKSGQCSKVDEDNRCVEQCIAKYFAKPPHNYSVDLSHGENCQTYANDAVSYCEAQCHVRH